MPSVTNNFPGVGEYNVNSMVDVQNARNRGQVTPHHGISAHSSGVGVEETLTHTLTGDHRSVATQASQCSGERFAAGTGKASPNPAAAATSRSTERSPSRIGLCRRLRGVQGGAAVAPLSLYDPNGLSGPGLNL